MSFTGKFPICLAHDLTSSLSYDITASCLLLKLTVTPDFHSHPKILLSYHAGLPSAKWEEAPIMHQ